VNVSRVVRKGVSSDGSVIFAVLSAVSTAVRPSRAMSMSVAVLSLTEIIASATSRTLTRVPSGLSCRVSDEKLLTRSVIVSFSSHVTLPEAIALAKAFSTYSLKTEATGTGVSASIVWIGRQVPLVTSATSNRTLGATERAALSTPAQLVGADGTAARRRRPLIRPCASTVKFRCPRWDAPIVTTTTRDLARLLVTETR
jgi:hypothetical protein